MMRKQNKGSDFLPMQIWKNSELSIILTSLIFHCELAMINFCPPRSSIGKWVVLRRELGGNAVDEKSVVVGIGVGYQKDPRWAKKSSPPVWGGGGQILKNHLSCTVAKGSYHLKLVRSDLDFLLWSAIQGACSSLALCTSIVRVLFQALEPTAFLVHPVLAAIAEDAVAAHFSATDSAWKLAWTLQEVQSRTADHDLCLSCIYSQSFLLHCFFPSQEPPDTFLEWFSDNNKVVGIEVLPGDPIAELSWSRSGGTQREFPCAEFHHSSTPSFLSAHQMTFRGTRSNAFSRSTKAM